MTNSPSRNQPRKFEYTAAVRKAVPLLIGINGPSGCGKTYSALRLATGIQKVVGGDIAGIDTEANRMLHYADKFKFVHVPFTAPFSPSDYLEAIEFVVSKGARTVVIDSSSHLHDGPGGVLEMHAAEVERMGGGERNNFPAWAKPKADLRRFINNVTTGIGDSPHPLNLIFCFRAKNKMKIERGAKEIEKLGFMPIASDEFIYEMTTNILLYPGSRGVPTWQTQRAGEQDVIKLPDQFQDMFGARAQLDEAMGEKMALWSTGGSAPKISVNPVVARRAEEWIGYWSKKGVSPDQILAIVGKASVDHLDEADFVALKKIQDRIKAKEVTVAQAFTVSSPAPDDEEPTLDDEEEANRRAAEPTAEEIARMNETANGAGTATTKGA